VALRAWLGTQGYKTNPDGGARGCRSSAAVRGGCRGGSGAQKGYQAHGDADFELAGTFRVAGLTGRNAGGSGVVI
jgi:hypothetical protein